MMPKDIVIPVSIDKLLKDSRGYPIPFFQFIPTTYAEDKKVDFRIKDPIKVIYAMQNRICGICGEEMFKRAIVAFIGGPDEIEQQVFSDPPMHMHCARFAMLTCPFLANRHYRPLDKPIEGTIDDPTRAKFRPESVGIMKARSYEMVEVKGHAFPHCYVQEVFEIEWF